MAGILDYFSQFFGAPQPAPAGAPAPDASAAPAQAPQPQQTPQGMLSGLTPDQVNAMIAKARPGMLGTLLGSFGRSGSFDQVRDQITKENLARALLPQKIALQQQGIAYGQSIKDPALRELYFNDRPAYSAIEQKRLGPTTVDKDTTVYGAGANGDQTYNGAVTLGQGDTLTTTGGKPITSTAPKPTIVSASDSVWNPITGEFNQAPARPEVVKSGPAESVDVVTPGKPGAPSPASPGGDQGQPRGIRNNNPWNVTNLSKGQKWAGQTGVDGQFAQFGSAKAGAQAADRNLLAKFTLHGLNTIQGVIADPTWGWDKGNTQYAAQVAQAMGVKPTDQIDLTNPTVRANMLHAMLPIESGRGAPSAVQGGAVQHVRSGATPRQLSPEEVQQRGLAPGIWSQNPDGTIVPTSPAPKGDVDRVNSLLKTAEMYDNLENYDQEFEKVAKQYRPGWGYQEKVLGFIPNPYADWAEHNTPVAQMHDLHNKELFVQKPDNAGQRILASEIPLWGTAAVDPGKSQEANQALIAQHRTEGEQIRAKALFYKNWLDQHGNLNGADAAWIQRKGAQKPPTSAGGAGGGFRIVQ